jgi:hypothetical protein
MNNSRPGLPLPNVRYKSEVASFLASTKVRSRARCFKHKKGWHRVNPVHRPFVRMGPANVVTQASDPGQRLDSSG